MRIYVITAGEYSDYHICGVAIDREKAEEIRQHYSDSWDEANIEEYDTDDYYAEKGKFYHIALCDSNVSVSKTGVANINERNHVWTSLTKNPHYYVIVKAMDEEHAKKIGLDLIAKYKAEQEGL